MCREVFHLPFFISIFEYCVKGFLKNIDFLKNFYNIYRPFLSVFFTPSIVGFDCDASEYIS